MEIFRKRSVGKRLRNALNSSAEKRMVGKGKRVGRGSDEEEIGGEKLEKDKMEDN